MTTDNLILRVLQQGSELVKLKLKACELHKDSGKELNTKCYSEYNAEPNQEITKIVHNYLIMQKKLDIAIKALEHNQKNHVAKEALEKIKEIKDEQ